LVCDAARVKERNDERDYLNDLSIGRMPFLSRFPANDSTALARATTYLPSNINNNPLTNECPAYL